MIMTIPTNDKRQVVDLTDLIAEHCRGMSGHVHVFVQHTTAAITSADLDPGTDLDLLDALAGMLPQLQWRHPHNPPHAPDHLLASIIGPSLVVGVSNGVLQLGRWQRIVLVELNGPQERTVDVSLIGNAEQQPVLAL
ncbi:MAG TPA: secondary thiamine-phosphate synthase enzyme YjbQ [Candidatus Saccharimonadales bacterium]|nr:secondary thiamine-phosphate synthase enzyme YjbQ [Candidatus Saccharimonadales bacterium]